MPPGTADPSPETLREAESKLASTAPGYLAQVREATSHLAVRDLDGDDASAAIGAVEELADIDLDVPTASRIPAARLLKRMLKRMVGWYLGYFARQIEALGQAIANLGAILLDRTEKLDQANSSLRADLARLAERVDRLERGGPGSP
jgi:hypothetical protein